MFKSSFIAALFLLTIFSCNENNNESLGIDIPMPTREEIPMDYLEKTLFLGWSENNFSVFYYLKEFTGYESDSYTIKLLSQNAVNDKVEVIKDFTSYYGDEGGFTYLEEFLEIKKTELKSLLKDLGVTLNDADFETKSILKMDDLEWSFNVNNQNVGNSQRFSTKVVVNKPDGTSKSILNHKRNKSTLYTDMKYLGYILNPSQDNVVVVTYLKSEALEGASLYSPFYIGCSLNDINGLQSSNTTTTTPMKNGKKLLKESEIRGLLIGKWYLDVENIIGEPDETYRTHYNSSMVYYNSVLDNFDNSIKHMCVFIVDDHVKDIFTCKRGGKLQLNGLDYITTSK